MAYYLLTNYDSNAEVKTFLDKYDFYVFPIVNPDGMTANAGVQKHTITANCIP
jgi:murein tripeptide amidase MpaA